MKKLNILLGALILSFTFSLSAKDINNASTSSPLISMVDASGSFGEVIPVITVGTTQLTVNAGSGYFGVDNLVGKLTDKKAPLAKVEITFYKPATGKKGDYQDDKGVWWDEIGKVTTDKNGEYDFDTDDDKVAGNVYYCQSNWIEGEVSM